MLKVTEDWKKGFVEGFVKFAENEYDIHDATHASSAYWEDEYTEDQQLVLSKQSKDEQYSKGFSAGKNEVRKWLENEDE